MRWIRFEWEGRPHLGSWSQAGIHDLTGGLPVLTGRPGGIADPVRQSLAAGDLVAFIGTGATSQSLGLTPDQLQAMPLRRPEQVNILPPITHPPKNIICVGRNFHAHAIESAKFRGQQPQVPQHPVFFTKPPTSIVGFDDDIIYEDDVTQQLDYEGEIAVVIGRAGRHIPVEEALDYVFGYTLMNDVTARDLQGLHQQFFRGKGLDTFAPLGPVVLEKSVVPDPAALNLKTFVNGELRQQATLADLIFDIPTLIHVLSSGMTLQPGDVVATGTPEGVGAGFQPPKFLRDGDVVEVTSDPIGTLRNQVRLM